MPDDTSNDARLWVTHTPHTASTGPVTNAMSGLQSSDSPKYDGFLAYRRQSESWLADALEAALENLGRHFSTPDAGVDLFRDVTNGVAGPEAWPVICQAMRQSRWLVVLASPHAAQSRWVDKEILHWLDVHGTSRLVIVCAAGSWRWDELTRTFIPNCSSAIPKTLLRPLAHRPPIVDLSWTNATMNLRTDQRFIGLTAALAALLRTEPDSRSFPDRLDQRLGIGDTSQTSE